MGVCAEAVVAAANADAAAKTPIRPSRTKARAIIQVPFFLVTPTAPVRIRRACCGVPISMWFSKEHAALKCKPRPAEEWTRAQKRGSVPHPRAGGACVGAADGGMLA